MKFSTKMILLFICLTTVPVMFMGLSGYVNVRDILTRQIVQQLISIADAKEKQINSVIYTYLENIRLIALESVLAEYAQMYARTPTPMVYKALSDKLYASKQAVEHIVAIAVRDTSGRIIATTDDAGAYISSDARASDMVKSGESLEDIFLDYMRIPRVRLVSSLQVDGKIVGTVEIIALIDPIMQVTAEYSGLGMTGEVVLVKKNSEGDALFIAPTRFESGAAFTRVVSKNQMNLPAVYAIQGEERIFTGSQTRDHRGERVLAVTRYIDSSGWGLVVAIDQEEAFAPIAILFKTFASILIVTIILLTIMIALISRIIMRPILRLSAYVDQIDDAASLSVPMISMQSQDEIGHLSRAIVGMATKLQSLYAGLEQKVKDRTKDLDEKVADLERLNKLMVDRELKMIELKKELHYQHDAE